MGLASLPLWKRISRTLVLSLTVWEESRGPSKGSRKHAIYNESNFLFQCFSVAEMLRLMRPPVSLVSEEPGPAHRSFGCWEKKYDCAPKQMGGKAAHVRWRGVRSGWQTIVGKPAIDFLFRHGHGSLSQNSPSNSRPPLFHYGWRKRAWGLTLFISMINLCWENTQTPMHFALN